MNVSSGYVGNLYSFEINKGDYVLTKLAESNKAGYENADSQSSTNLTLVDKDEATTGKIKYVNDANGSVQDKFEIDDNAIVFWRADTTKAKIFSGKELKSLAASGGASTDDYSKMITAYATSKANGFESAVVVAVSGQAYPTFTVGSTYAYLTADAYKTYEDGKWFINYTMWTANGEVKAKAEGTNLTNLSAGNVVCYNNVDSNGIVKDLHLVMPTLAVVEGWDGAKKIKLSGTSANIVSDTQILYVNSDKKVGVEGGAIAIGADTNGDGDADVANVRYIMDTVHTDEVALIVVDVNNEMKAGTSMTVTAAKFDEALASFSSVTVTDAIEFSDNSVIDEGKTVVFNETVDVVAGKTLTINGNVTIKGELDLNSTGKIVIGAKGSLTLVAAQDAADLEGIEGVAGATLVVKAESSNASSNTAATKTGAAKFFKAAGKAPVTTPTPVPGVNGIPALDGSTNKIEAGTYTYSTVYVKDSADGDTAISAWLK